MNTMPHAVQWSLLYLFMVLLVILSFYLAKAFFSFRQKIIGKPTYPLVKAFSVLLIAFTLQNGLSQVLFRVTMYVLGYEDYVYTTNPHSSNVFYIVVGAVAITYIFSLRDKKE